MQIIKIPVRWLFTLLFRVRVEGIQHYREAGDRVLIIANHVSLLDGMLLYLYLPERPTFAINTMMARKWYFQPFLWTVDLFPLDPTNPLSTKSLIRFLQEDRKAVIFPEGRITVTGSLMKIYEGTGLVADKADTVILPIGIEGAQYSKLSYLKGKVKTRWFPRIRINFLPPVRIDLDDELQGHERRKAAAKALSDIMLRLAVQNCNYRTTLFLATLEAMERHGTNRVVTEDIERQPLNFRQLITRAFILGQLVSRETQLGENVGILLPNVNATLVMFMALQARGRVPAMLNFTAGEQGLVTACETGQIRTVYTSRKFVDNAGLEAAVETLGRHVNVNFLEDFRSKVSLVTKLRGALAARAPGLTYRLKNRRRDPDAPAVLLFTSGSEGVPKGVVLSHVNLLANRAQVQTLIDLTSRDIVFNAMPVFHSFGLLGGVILPLLDGAKIFLYPSPLHYRLIPELCYELGATVLFGTNTFLAGYARYGHPFDFYSMRFVVAGAEKLQEDTRQIWAEKFGIRILEGYGATETSPVLGVNTPMGNKTGTIGQLLSGIEHYLEPVDGIHEGGRLVVKGPNVMKGYLFHGHGEISPPWTERAGPGWYDTGDIVMVDADGYVKIIGRAKRFAKIGGEMVSLTGVEELAAATWPNGVHGAMTVADAKRGEQIVLVTDYPDAERRELVEVAKAQGFSEISIPRRVLVTETVPVLGTGKIDYRGLAQLLEDYN